MRSQYKVALVAVLVVGLGGLAWWQQQRREEAEATAAALTEASAAMKKLNAQDERFPLAFQEAMGGVTSELLLAPARAGATLKAKVLPIVDGYLATIDRALQRSDAYLARAPDPELEPRLAKIRARGAELRKFRDKIAGLAARAEQGAPVDELTSGLAAAGTILMLSGLASP